MEKEKEGRVNEEVNAETLFLAEVDRRIDEKIKQLLFGEILPSAFCHWWEDIKTEAGRNFGLIISGRLRSRLEATIQYVLFDAADCTSKNAMGRLSYEAIFWARLMQFQMRQTEKGLMPWMCKNSFELVCLALELPVMASAQRMQRCILQLVPTWNQWGYFVMLCNMPAWKNVNPDVLIKEKAILKLRLAALS